MQKLSINLIFDNGKHDVNITINDKIIPCIKNFHIDFTDNNLQFKADRLKTDRMGQFFVDENGETAKEEVNMLLYLNELFQNYEIINSIKKAIDFWLENIRLTSMANAKNVINERLGGDENGDKNKT